MKKIGASNCLSGSINLVTLVLSILLISAGIWLSRNVDTHQCGTDAILQVQWVLIGIGIVGIFLSIAGFVGSCFRIKWLLVVYLFVLFLFILLLIVETILLFVNAVHDHSAPNYLRTEVNSPEKWSKITTCLSKSRVCTNLANNYPIVDVRFPSFLDPIEAGCCGPPKECNFTFKNATNWVPPATITSSNPDCRKWSNDINQLCFDCDSCKDGFVRYGNRSVSRESYMGIAIGSLVVLIIVVVIFYIGYRALRNVKKRDAVEHHKHATPLASHQPV